MEGGSKRQERQRSLCLPFLLITCPAMGFLQAPQTPLATVATPSLFRSDCRLPSMLSSWLPGFGGPPGGELLLAFPWAMNCVDRKKGWSGLEGRTRGISQHHTWRAFSLRGTQAE